jgi:hypothetical protein
MVIDMSLAEVIKEVEGLSPEERANLQEYLAERARKSRSDRVAQVTAAMRRMDADRRVPLEKLEAMHEALVKLGV